ncbi:glycosyltransferase [Anabaena subtropica]|uniref:Glycosyltransferase n=1 Tax=Anabaena subtropica FACHB-260 TaxID=2692884 RepID=A0ABR8CMM1_9NOST|nr:glycosyltransferase [Anabaena subtropica]MBD2343422.1 glycosyltransferase [Anabaena subtropica FACHB-260]
MKILHLPVAYLPWTIGGREVYCHRLCQNLQLLGADVQVAIHQDVSGREPLGNHHHEGVPVCVLPPISDHGDRVASVSRTTNHPIGFREVLAEYQPNIVHFHDSCSSAGITHMRLSKEAGCKVVMTYHSPGQSCLQSALLYHGKQVCDGKISGYRCTECRLSYAGLPSPVARFVALGSPPWIDPASPGKINHVLTARKMTELHHSAWLEIIELVDALHVHAAWVKDIVLLNGADPQKVHFLRPGGPNPVSHLVQLKSHSDFLNIVFVGRCIDIKGIHILIAAVKLLPKELPIKVTFFGPYWESKNYGRNLLQQIKGDVRFELKHNLPNTQIVETLANYDVCVVPSIWLETGPLTVLEAFAAGVPVIGSRLGGIVELVRDEVDGILFEPGNAHELANIFTRLARNRELIEKLKMNIKPPKKMTSFAKDMLSLYQDLQK